MVWIGSQHFHTSTMVFKGQCHSQIFVPPLSSGPREHSQEVEAPQVRPVRGGLRLQGQPVQAQAAEPRASAAVGVGASPGVKY